MAEESINPPVTPEISNPEKGNAKRSSIGKPNYSNGGKNILPLHRRASIGPCQNGGNSRQNSIGKTSSPTSEKSVLPNYLRASTGSCHDFCKYGREHTFEKVKPWRSTPKRITPPPAQKTGVTVVQAETKKKTMSVKLKPSSFSNNNSPETPEIIKREVPLLPKKVVLTEHDSSNDKKITQNERKMTDLSAKRASSVKPKAVSVKKLLSSSDTSVSLNGRRNSESKIGKRTVTSKAAVKEVLPTPSASLSPKPSLTRVLSLNARKHKSVKLVSPLKNQNRTRKSETKNYIDDSVQEKTLHVIKTQPSNKLMQSPKSPSHLNSTALSSPEEEEDLHVFKTQLSNKLMESPNSPSHLNSTSPSSPEEEEKDLHVIKTQLSNKLMESPTSSSQLNSTSLSSHEEEEEEEEEEVDESEYSDSEEDDSVLENDETANMNNAETSERNHKRVSRKAGMALSEDKEDVPTKLKFRRGKIVDLQSENNGPRKLRFRRGRVLGENQESKGNPRRSFKKRGINDDTSGNNPDSEKVVLRHQDAQEGKKDPQGLFNNVIEETASKLVETRKSKVKALVGAFETVISLQEKPPAHTVT